MVAYRDLEATWRTPGGRPAVFAYREDTNDWNTISATMTHDEYHLPLGLRGVAVDVGGYVGSVGIGLALDNPEARVWIIEPVPPNQDLIARNIERNDIGDRVTLIRGAVGKGGESVDVWYGYRGTETAEHHAFVGNSTLAYNKAGPLRHDTATYTALGLGDILAMTGDIDWLKIDTEGAEWSFLRSSWTSRVQTIVGEAHAVRKHKGSDIVGLLSKTHDVTLTGDTEGTCEFAAVRR